MFLLFPIIVYLISALDGPVSIVSAHCCPSLLLAMALPCLLSHTPYCLVTPIGTTLLFLLFVYFTGPHLEVSISSMVVRLYFTK